jgi:putative oxidoreductase
MNTSMLVVRLLIGGLFISHGVQKLLGPRQQPVTGCTEVGGGALFAMGLLTPLGAAAIIGVMINATLAVHRRDGRSFTSTGYEYNLVLAATAFAIALTGPGTMSLDALLNVNTGGWWAVAGLALGAAAARVGNGPGSAERRAERSAA